jgi:hypothetical protein
MIRGSLLASVTAALALGFVAVSAEAAPVSGVTGGLSAVDTESAVQVRHRCYRHRGHLHCPRHHHDYYGYRPGIHFHVGPRRHHHHRRYRHY